VLRARSGRNLHTALCTGIVSSLACVAVTIETGDQPRRNNVQVLARPYGGVHTWLRSFLELLAC